MSLKPDNRTITDEQLDRGLEVLREQQARLEATPAGHAIVDGDYIVLDLQGTLDGAPLEGTKKDGQLHKVGSHASVLGLEIDSHVGGRKRERRSKFPSRTQTVIPILALPARRLYSP